MTETTRRPEFVVDLGGLEIPDEVRRQIAADIQRVVLVRLADLDLRGDYGIRFPDLYGIVIREDLEGRLFA